MVQMTKFNKGLINHKILLLLIILFSFVLRYLNYEYINRKYPERFISFYHDIAINIINHQQFGRNAEFGWTESERQPLYPLVLSVLYMIFGISIRKVALLHSIIGTAVVYMTFLIAKQLFNKKIGLLASFITMCYPYYVVNTTAMTDGPLFTLMLLCLTLVLLKSFSSPSLNKFLLSGFILGIAVLCRATILAMLFFVVIWILFILKLEIIKKIKFIFFFLFIFLLTIMPWLIRNHIVLGKPVITSSFGSALWLSNHPDLIKHGYPEVTIDYHYVQLLKKIPDSQKEYLSKLTIIDRDKFFYKEALSNIKNMDYPQYFKMIYIKLKAAYSLNLNPKYNVDFKQTGKEFKFLIYKITYAPILFIAIIGIYLNRKRWKELYIIFSIFISLTITFIIFWAHTQHRAALDIYLIIFSALAIFNWIKMLRNWIKNLIPIFNLIC